MQNGSSVGICTRCIHVFARLAPDLYAQSVLIHKISASELSRKFIKSALLVGNWSLAVCPRTMCAVMMSRERGRGGEGRRGRKVKGGNEEQLMWPGGDEKAGRGKKRGSFSLLPPLRRRFFFFFLVFLRRQFKDCQTSVEVGGTFWSN